MTQTLDPLFALWDDTLAAYEQLPKAQKAVGYHDPVIAALAIHAVSRGAFYDDWYQRDARLHAIHGDFGVLEALGGRQSKKLWHRQARRIRQAKRRYGIA